MGPYGPKWTRMGPNGPIWAQMGPNGPKWAQMDQHEPKWAHLGPIRKHTSSELVVELPPGVQNSENVTLGKIQVRN